MKKILWLAGICLLYANDASYSHPLQLPEPLSQPFSDDNASNKPRHVGNEWVYSDDNTVLETGKTEYHDGNRSMRMGNVHVFDSQSPEPLLEGSLTTFGNRIFHESREEPSVLPSPE